MAELSGDVEVDHMTDFGPRKSHQLLETQCTTYDEHKSSFDDMQQNFLRSALLTEMNVFGSCDLKACEEILMKMCACNSTEMYWHFCVW